MELWVRSQDRTILSKAQNIIIRENQNENNETNYAIVDIYTMGIYKTKERAMQVLDEIQEILKPKTIIKFNEKEVYDEKENRVIGTLFPYETFDIKQLSTYVYEMPID